MTNYILWYMSMTHFIWTCPSQIYRISRLWCTCASDQVQLAALSGQFWIVRVQAHNMSRKILATNPLLGKSKRLPPNQYHDSMQIGCSYPYIIAPSSRSILKMMFNIANLCPMQFSLVSLVFWHQVLESSSKLCSGHHHPSLLLGHMALLSQGLLWSILPSDWSGDDLSPHRLLVRSLNSFGIITVTRWKLN